MGQASKLVRDRIPQIIAAAGGSCVVRTLDEDEYIQRLDEKLAEEAAEYQQDRTTEELVDIVEVVQAIALQRGISWPAFEQLREHKRSERGGFAARQLMMSSDTPPATE